MNEITIKSTIEFRYNGRNMGGFLFEEEDSAVCTDPVELRFFRAYIAESFRNERIPEMKATDLECVLTDPDGTRTITL